MGVEWNRIDISGRHGGTGSLRGLGLDPRLSHQGQERIATPKKISLEDLWVSGLEKTPEQALGWALGPEGVQGGDQGLEPALNNIGLIMGLAVSVCEEVRTYAAMGVVVLGVMSSRSGE